VGDCGRELRNWIWATGCRHSGGVSNGIGRLVINVGNEKLRLALSTQGHRGRRKDEG
jgi:hypothetical protein